MPRTRAVCWLTARWACCSRRPRHTVWVRQFKARVKQYCLPLSLLKCVCVCVCLCELWNSINALLAILAICYIKSVQQIVVVRLSHGELVSECALVWVSGCRWGEPQSTIYVSQDFRQTLWNICDPSDDIRHIDRKILRTIVSCEQSWHEMKLNACMCMLVA